MKWSTLIVAMLANAVAAKKMTCTTTKTITHTKQTASTTITKSVTSTEVDTTVSRSKAKRSWSIRRLADLVLSFPDEHRGRNFH